MKDLVFLVDVDNTLLDNDKLKSQIQKTLDKVLGKNDAKHFWKHYDGFKSKHNLVDFPRIVREYCAEKDKGTCDIRVATILNSLDFKACLYPESLKVIAYLKTLGQVYLFTEGDAVYQRMKVVNSELDKAVDGVFLFEHKLDHLDEIMKKFSGAQIVLIEDKAKILSVVTKKFSQIKVVEICQGHYGKDDHVPHDELDIVVDNISELLKFNKGKFAK